MAQLNPSEIITIIESAPSEEKAQLAGEVANAMFNRAMNTPPYPEDEFELALSLTNTLYHYVYISV